MDYYAQDSLGEVLVPDEITSSNGDYEKLAKLVSEQYFAYTGNYSGNTKFDVEHGSKDINCQKE